LRFLRLFLNGWRRWRRSRWSFDDDLLRRFRDDDFLLDRCNHFDRFGLEPSAELIGKTVLNSIGVRCDGHTHMLQLKNDFGVV